MKKLFFIWSLVVSNLAFTSTSSGFGGGVSSFGRNPIMEDNFNYREFNSILENSYRNFHPSRLSGLVKDLPQITTIEYTDEQRLKNDQELRHALMLLKDGQSEVTLENGTVMPLVDMVSNYLE